MRRFWLSRLRLQTHGPVGSSSPERQSALADHAAASTDGHVSHDADRLAATRVRRAAAAHGEHEKRNGGQHDANWPDWYAEYIVREQAGKELPL